MVQDANIESSKDYKPNGSFKAANVESDEIKKNVADRKEDQTTKEIEKVTTRVPSSTFLGLALCSIGISAVLQLYGKKETSNFVGQWAPTILIMGLYNKMVKLHEGVN